MIGIVYKIYNDEECYIGSTYDLDTRMRSHKSINNDCISKKIIDKGNYKVEVLEEYNINIKEELLWREREWIDKTDKCINILTPIITEGERKEREKLRQKIYREKNKEIINQQRKEYYQENKEKIKEKNKIYYKKIKEKIKEKILCECGGCYTIYHKKKHLRTNKHQNYLNNNNI